jgi:hypothetical protein
MHRTLVEISIVLGASIVVTAGVFFAGSSLKRVPPPLPTFLSQRSGCLDAPISPLNDSGIMGQAKLCIIDEAVRPEADVVGLNPGSAYATWLAYFDQPHTCRKPRCTITDLRGETATGVAGRMDGMVAGGIRKAQFFGDFRDLRLKSGSQVSLLVMDRGPVSDGDARARARQLLTLHVDGANGLEGMTVGGEHVVGQAIFDLP